MGKVVVGFCYQSHKDFENVSIDESVSVYVSVPRIASDSSESIEVTIIQHDTVTATYIRVHHVSICFTLTFVQGHTYLNHENNKGSITSETVQARPIKFPVKIVRIKVYIILASPMTLTVTQGYNCVDKRDTFLLVV